MGIALALLCVQDVDAWIRDLGSEDAARRDAAVQRLIEAGEAAEPALRRAAESRDPDIAARAKAALARIDLHRRAAGIVERLPAKLLETAPETLERLADGDEESLLKLVADFRGIAPEAEGGWVEMVGAAYGEIESSLLAPVFRIIFEKMEAARAAGAPMRRLEFIYANALYWYSDEPNSATSGGDTVIRAVSSERLLAFVLDGADRVDSDDLLDYLQEEPPFGEAARVRSLLDREDADWRALGIELVAAIGDRASIPRLRELLSEHPDEAARALATLADTESIPAILDLYEEAGEDDKHTLASALLFLEAVGHAESFGRHVGGESWAFYGLTEQRPTAMIPALIEWAAGDEARELDHDALMMLAQARTEEADELLFKHLDSDNPSRRQDAWWAMAAAGRGDELAGRLDEETPPYALRYAIECGIEGAEARLLESVAQGNADALWVVRVLRLAAAAPALVESFKTSGDFEALRALATLPTDHFDRGAAGWPATEVVQAAADAGRSLPEDLVRPLLADEDASVRFAAARLLSDVAAVRALRDESDGELTTMAHEWLSAHGDEADVARATEAAGADAWQRDLIGALAARRAPGAARLLMRSMSNLEAVPFHLNALAQPKVWDRLRETKLPDGAPGWPTLEALAAWLTERGIAVTIDERVRESFRREHVSTRAGTVLELLEGVHSTCTNVRLLDGGTIRIETGVTARAAWLDWWAGQKP